MEGALSFGTIANDVRCNFCVINILSHRSNLYPQLSVTIHHNMTKDDLPEFSNKRTQAGI